jgi:Ca2+-transporting ATPase
VSKDAAVMILTDDNFATIVKAIEYGRELYDNLSKYIRFQMAALVGFIATFLGAAVLSIADGIPFSPLAVLWINFLITAPVGIALGLDKQTPGLMQRRPRPRAASIMTPAVITTVGLVGLFMSLAIDALIVCGTNSYGCGDVAITMGLVAFSLMLVVAAFESRDEKASILQVETFDNSTLNITALVEIALAVMIARGAALTTFLGAAPLSSTQWLIGALPALVLFVAWELGKAIARRTTGSSAQAAHKES